MKYLIGMNQAGWFHPIIFCDEIVHSEAAKALPKQCSIIGAGFCCENNSEIHVHGRSVSLNISPSERDGMILTLFLKANLSGLALQNYIAFLQMSRL